MVGEFVMQQQATDHRRLNPFVVAAAVLLGLILLASGIGKVPGQTEFVDALLKSFWTPPVAYFIGYVLPWAETALGLLLVLGIFTRLTAAVCLPLTAGFMANNIWAMTSGVTEFPECAYCFGVWEEFFGALSPSGALIVDIVLFCLALTVLLLNRESLWTFRPWFIRRKSSLWS